MLYLAYTREDALFAVQLAEDLAGLGIDVWLDINEIGAASDWTVAQRAAIQACEGLIAVLSPEAMDRDHMRQEVKQAFDAEKAIYVAAARRAPWRDWLRGLPIADFTVTYDDGLDALVLNILGGTKPRPASRATAATSQPAPHRKKKKPDKSWLARLIKR